MKHVFVINPRAGKVDRVQEISDQLKEFENQIDYEIYETKSRGDAREFVANYLKTHDGSETYRFYAVGGDGTLHDVTNGAFGHENAEVACYASGSGNDFIKNFGNGPEFKDLKSLINGAAEPIDVIKVNDKVSINIFSFGFDGEVTFAMHRFKRWPLVNGKMAYNLGAVTSLLFKMKNKMKITIDDEVIFDDKGTLVAVCNGHTYGGGFLVGPKASINDGLLDVCLAKKISRFKASMLMAGFKKGEHVSDPRYAKIIDYRKCKKVTIESPKLTAYQIDGETFRINKLEAEVVPLGLKFVRPAKMA